MTSEYSWWHDSPDSSSQATTGENSIHEAAEMLMMLEQV